ncbi:MAG: hypothetical protein WBX22_07325 [Silvibacterium sp.]|jgi:hypothetical protein
MQTFKGVAGAGCDLPNDESLAAQIRTTAVLTEKQLADRLGLSEKSLRRQRCQGIGFPYVKLGSGRNVSVRYYLPHVLDHLEKCKRVPSVRAWLSPVVHRTQTKPYGPFDGIVNKRNRKAVVLPDTNVRASWVN